MKETVTAFVTLLLVLMTMAHGAIAAQTVQDGTKVFKAGRQAKMRVPAQGHVPA
jgi:hypothetical protein